MPGSMTLGLVDIVVFVGFLAVVVGISLYAARRERTREGYFLAGRSLGWPLIGISLIASNISTEHFVGMTGSAAGSLGLAVASYEWLAAIALVLVGWFFLPRFLGAGIYTIPEFLEYRFSAATRTTMSVILLVATVAALLATVLYSGAIALEGIFGLSERFAAWFGLSLADDVPWHRSASTVSLLTSIVLIGTVAGAYTVYGGLKAVVWSDLLQGVALLVGGAIVAWIALRAVGDGSVIDGWTTLRANQPERFHLVRPADDPDIPWTALVGGLWIPVLFYWGLNQFIVQRTLAARTLAAGQRGVVFAAFLKILLPLVVVIPGIAAVELYGERIAREGSDLAYPILIAELVPPALRGLLLAALAGAVMSTFNSGLNSASTLFTIDLWPKITGRTPARAPDEGDAPDRDAPADVESVDPHVRGDVLVGRVTTVVLVVISCAVAPLVARFEGVFAYIQEIWGLVSPAALAVFVVGFASRRAPAWSATTALIVGPLCYAALRFGGPIAGIDPENLPWLLNQAFLTHMVWVFAACLALQIAAAFVTPRTSTREIPRARVEVRTPLDVWIGGALVIAIVIAIYVAFA